MRTDGQRRGRRGIVDHPVLLWVSLEGDRRAVAGVLAVVTFVTLVAVGHWYGPASSALRSGDPVETAFQALVGGIVTGVTLVVSLNQLVLSQELGAVGDQRERLSGAVQFRADVAEAVGRDVSDPDPAVFLSDIVTAAAEAAEGLAERTGDDAAVGALCDDVASDADDVASALAGARFGTFAVLSPALDFNYSAKLVAARRLQAGDDHGIGSGTEAEAALEGLIRLLELFGTAREHFKTLYFQRDLILLSRRIVAVAVPALLVAVGTLLYVDPSTYGGTVAGVDELVVLVGFAATLALAPFLLLLSHILRIATVTGRTLSIGPFVLQPEDEASTGEAD